MDLITFKNILEFGMSSFQEKNTQFKAFKIILNKKFKNFVSSNININNRYRKGLRRTAAVKPENRVLGIKF